MNAAKIGVQLAVRNPMGWTKQAKSSNCQPRQKLRRQFWAFHIGHVIGHSVNTIGVYRRFDALADIHPVTGHLDHRRILELPGLPNIRRVSPSFMTMAALIEDLGISRASRA